MRFWRRKPHDAAPLSAQVKRQLVNYTPPEGVPIGLELASWGARFGAVVLDFLIAWAVILLLILLIYWLGVLPMTAFASLMILLGFFAGIPYYVTSELIWHGRTLGKRIVGIRVVSANGQSLRPHQVVARNLLKEVEFFTPVSLLFSIDTMAVSFTVITLLWSIFVLVYLLRSPRKQRLGDTVADTLVVVRPKAVLLQDLALASPKSRFVFDQAQLDIYGRYELQTLETILRNPSKTAAQQAELHKVAAAIVRRIGYTEQVKAADVPEFLMAFYREQRERLESRQLFGDRRDDKFHADTAKKP